MKIIQGLFIPKRQKIILKKFERSFILKTIRFLSVLITIALFLAPRSVLADNAKNWFFKSAKDHAQPKLMGGADYSEHGVLSIGSPNDKVVYLTFDAGYENGNVEKTLDVLKKHDAPGAFFILPAIIKSNTELIKRMADEGHTVCNHTYSHKSIAYMSKKQLSDELKKLEDVYREYTGREMTKFFRPPEGSFSVDALKNINELGYTTVFWSFAYADWDNKAQKDHSWAKKKILDNVHDGMVLLLHPTSSTNAAILDEVLTEIEKMGYRFGSLDELKSYADSIKGKTALPTSKLLEEYKEMGIVYTENKSAEKHVALTFDDGPHESLTLEILDILDENGVKATFFPIGKNVSEHPDVMREVINRGHEVGNHTYSHANVSKLSRNSLENEIQKTEAILKKLGAEPILFRPPGGAYSKNALDTVSELGYKYILWSWRLDTKDWSSPPVEQVVKTVKENVTDGGIILFHDYVAKNSPTPNSLRVLIPYLKEQGYTFVTVSELIAI